MSATMIGIGDKISRKNEITPFGVASLRYFLAAYHYKAIQYGADRFGLTINRGEQGSNWIEVAPGMVYAYGYVGVLDSPARFYFNLPSIAQNWVIVARLDLSVVPAEFKVYAFNNHAASTISVRQDVLSTFPTGVFEYPIAALTITPDGIVSASVKNVLKKQLVGWREEDDNVNQNYPAKVETATVSADKLFADGSADDGVIGATQPLGDDTRKIATTAFVVREIRNYINKRIVI